MNAAQIHAAYKSSLHFLSTGQLKNAFDATRMLVEELQMGDYTDRLDDFQQNYRYLLHYYVTGAEDPQRKMVYNKLIAKLFLLNTELREELLIRNSSNFEFTQKRYFPHIKHYQSAGELFNALKYYHAQSALLANTDQLNGPEIKRIRINYESDLTELFSSFWLTTHYQTVEKDLFQQVLEESYPGWLEKSLVVSALTLNLWHMFDESKIMMLFDVCQVAEQRVKQRALVGLCFVLAKYNRFLPYFPSVRNRLVLLADDMHIIENFQNIIIQIIATSETDKISKKLQEEILPEVMKISPLLKDKMDADSLLNSDAFEEENPEWHEMLEQSGLADKLQELTELQLEGADVYMSTFSMLKSFPFFQNFSNWFLPFDTQSSVVNELFESDEKTVLSTFVSSNAMCNSDKYSFCLSVMQMPEAQRDVLKQSFQLEAEQLEEMTKDEAILTPDLLAKNISKQYIQDLFRFFKLHPQHADFSDMFVSSLIMHRSYLFDILSAGNDLKSSVAEYYFLKNHYNQALELFEDIQKDTNPTASLYQKKGYSYQKTSQLSKALDAYLKADIIQPDDGWTIRKIALCYWLLGNFEKALEFYQHADFLKPNQPNVLLHVGHCYLELGKFKEALKVYFKLDVEDSENTKVWRAITWCSFVSGNLSQAEYFAQKLIENEPTAYDYLNAGHIAWCQRRLTDAVLLYLKSWNLLENNWEVFLEALNDDKQYLISNGIDAEEIPLFIDQLLYDTIVE